MMMKWIPWIRHLRLFHLNLPLDFLKHLKRDSVLLIEEHIATF